MRALTDAEKKKVKANKKPAGQRPFIFNSTTGQLVEISESFEAFLILTEPGLKARIATYLSAILKFDVNNLSARTKALARWMDDEIKDLNRSIDGYKSILDQYDNIKSALANSTSGFEDVGEISGLMNDFTLALGDFVEERDDLAFDRAATTVLNIRRQGVMSDALKKEIESYARAILQY